MRGYHCRHDRFYSLPAIPALPSNFLVVFLLHENDYTRTGFYFNFTSHKKKQGHSAMPLLTSMHIFLLFHLGLRFELLDDRDPLGLLVFGREELGFDVRTELCLWPEPLDEDTLDE